MKNEGASDKANKLVAYSSESNAKAKVAEFLADAAGADVYQIEPAVEYTQQY